MNHIGSLRTLYNMMNHIQQLSDNKANMVNLPVQKHWYFARFISILPKQHGLLYGVCVCVGWGGGVCVCGGERRDDTNKVKVFDLL